MLNIERRHCSKTSVLTHVAAAKAKSSKPGCLVLNSRE